jgi:hypothetical protein
MDLTGPLYTVNTDKITYKEINEVLDGEEHWCGFRPLAKF